MRAAVRAQRARQKAAAARQERHGAQVAAHGACAARVGRGEAHGQQGRVRRAARGVLQEPGRPCWRRALQVGLGPHTTRAGALLVACVYRHCNRSRLFLPPGCAWCLGPPFHAPASHTNPRTACRRCVVCRGASAAAAQARLRDAWDGTAFKLEMLRALAAKLRLKIGFHAFAAPAGARRLRNKLVMRRAKPHPFVAPAPHRCICTIRPTPLVCSPFVLFIIGRFHRSFAKKTDQTQSRQPSRSLPDVDPFAPRRSHAGSSSGGTSSSPRRR